MGSLVFNLSVIYLYGYIHADASRRQPAVEYLII